MARQSAAAAANTTLLKVDAHHHLFGPERSHYPMFTSPGVERFYGNTDKLKIEFGPSQFIPLARAQNVVKSVYIESGFVPPIDETAYVQAIADEHGFPHAIVAKVDLESARVAADLDVHMRSRNFRGVRLCLNWDPDSRRASAPRPALAREPVWRAGYAELGRRGLSADIMILPAQFNDLEALAEDFPHIPVILNHTGLPFPAGVNGLGMWHDGLRRLARYPNIAVKISGLGMVDPHWSVASIRTTISFTIETFGTDRCLFASNFPIDGSYSTYPGLFGAFETITASLSQDDRAKLFHDNAVRLYRL